MRSARIRVFAEFGRKQVLNGGPCCLATANLHISRDELGNFPSSSRINFPHQLGQRKICLEHGDEAFQSLFADFVILVHEVQRFQSLVGRQALGYRNRPTGAEMILPQQTKRFRKMTE